MKARSISTCSATTGSPKLSWADISDDDVEDLTWEVQCCEDMPLPDGGRDEAPPLAEPPRARPRVRVGAAATAAAARAGGWAVTAAGSGDVASMRARAAAQRGAFTNRRSPPAARSWPASPAGGPIAAAPVPAPSGGHNATGSFPVEVENIPVRLCNDVCIEAMLQQAGLCDFVLGVEVKQGGGTGAASIVLSTWNAAVKCYNHFEACAWSTGALRVKMGESKYGAQDPVAFAQDAAGFGWSKGAGVGNSTVNPRQDPVAFVQDAAGFGWPKGNEVGNGNANAAGLSVPAGVVTPEVPWASNGGCCYVAAVMPAFPFVQQGSQGMCITAPNMMAPVCPSGLGVPCS